MLGVDLGTSAVKAVITDPTGTVIGHAARVYTVLHTRPGWSEINPAEWLGSTAGAVREAIDRCAYPDIAAISFAGQMHGLVPTSSSGAAVRTAMLWSDSRAVPQLAICQQLPAAVRARLANPLTPGMAGPMLAWLSAAEPARHSIAASRARRAGPLT